MARIARLVVPGAPHHVTQRGNRRAQAFFCDADYRLYRDLLAESAAKAQTEIWAWCLMPNHVHLILVPGAPDGLRRTLAELHRRYTTIINKRNGWTGHLWQGRFGSVAMDDTHFLTALRYVTLNPVRARLVKHARDWPWSSARAHLTGRDDGVVTLAPVLERVIDFKTFLDEAPGDEAYAALRRAETTGRPAGSDAWISDLERRHGRTLTPRKRGPKPGVAENTGTAALFSKLSPK
jgi:putative transposase